MLPILEYCCLNKFCRLTQSAFIGLSDSYHKLASPIKVKQNLCTLTWSRKSWVSIQSFALSKCASPSLSGLPTNSGLKWDQFNWAFGGAPGAIRALGKIWLRGGWDFGLGLDLGSDFDFDFDFNHHLCHHLDLSLGHPLPVPLFFLFILLSYQLFSFLFTLYDI